MRFPIQAPLVKFPHENNPCQSYRGHHDDETHQRRQAGNECHDHHLGRRGQRFRELVDCPDRIVILAGIAVVTPRRASDLLKERDRAIDYRDGRACPVDAVRDRPATRRPREVDAPEQAHTQPWPLHHRCLRGIRWGEDVHPGDRVELENMPNEPAFANRYHAGDRGTVMYAHFAGMVGWQIFVRWDHGGNLMLLHGVDAYRVVTGE